MTVETRLRTAMAEAVAPFSPDPDALVSIARRRGLGIRRRRQALGAVGVAAAVAVAVLAPSLVAGDHRTRAPQPLTVDKPTVSSLDTGTTSPITGRSTAAALLYAVGQETGGTAADFRGQGDGEGPNTYAVFRYTPDGSQSAGEVGVNVQHFGGGAAKPGGDLAATLGRCDSFMEHCVPSTLPDGSKLITYDDRSDYHGGRGIRRVADLFRTDGVRVVASASNGLDVTERDEQVTRDGPVLTTAQLVAIVSQPWWGTRLPTYFAEQGDRLSPYTPVGGTIAATTAPPAKP